MVPIVRTLQVHPLTLSIYNLEFFCCSVAHKMLTTLVLTHTHTHTLDDSDSNDTKAH